MRDQRWPFWAFIILRPIQLIFSIIILGLTAYMTDASAGYSSFWYAPLGLVTALIATIYLVVSFVLYFRNRLLPLVVVILDAFCVLFYLIAMAGKGDAGFPSASCSYSYYGWYTGYYSGGVNTFCVVGKAAFALELLSMFLFIGTLALASLVLHKNKKDLRGKKYAAGNYDDGESAPGVAMETTEGKTDAVVPDVGVEQPIVPPQQIQTPVPAYIQTPPPQQPGSPVYYAQPGTQYPAQQTVYDPNQQYQAPPQHQQQPIQQQQQYQQPQTFYPQQLQPGASPVTTPSQQQTAYPPPPPQSPPIDTPEIAGQEVYGHQTQYPQAGQQTQYPPANVTEMPAPQR